MLEDDAESAWILAVPSATSRSAAESAGHRRSRGSHYAMARVLPEHRGQGVGNALYERPFRACAQDRAHLTLGPGPRRRRRVAALRESSAGSEDVRREFEVVLERRRRRHIAPSRRPGVELVTLAERPELVRAAYEVDVEVGARTVPSHGRSTSSRRSSAGTPTTSRAQERCRRRCVVALVDGEPVGYAGLRRRGIDVADRRRTC